jgi:hypothetical protein
MPPERRTGPEFHLLSFGQIATGPKFSRQRSISKATKAQYRISSLKIEKQVLGFLLT